MAENRTLLEAFAFTLLENEVLEREDIERIVDGYRGEPTPPPDKPVPLREDLEPGPAHVAAAERLEEQSSDDSRSAD